MESELFQQRRQIRSKYEQLDTYQHNQRPRDAALTRQSGPEVKWSSGLSQPHRIEHRRKILRTIRTKPEPDSYPAIESDTKAAPKSTAASMRMLIIELTIGNGGGAFRQAVGRQNRDGQWRD
jgi:hypothetical protein